MALPSSILAGPVQKKKPPSISARSSQSFFKPAVQTSLSPESSEVIRRQEEEETAEEERPVPEPESTAATEDESRLEDSPTAAAFQPKLEIGQPGDKYESEADSIADRVMRMPDHSLTSEGEEETEEEETSVRMKPTEAPVIQAKCKECEEEEKENLQMKAAVQRSPAQNQQAASSISHQLHASSGHGTPMPRGVQSEMGDKIGADFREVRLHTGPEATRMNESLGARAFTYGKNIYFNEGQYNPHSASGKHLLAHELTHVVQQNSALRTKQIQRKPDEAEHPFNIRIKFPFAELGISPDTDWMELWIRYEMYYNRITREKAIEHIKASNAKSGHYERSWRKPVSDKERKQGFIIVNQEVSPSTFIGHHLKDELGEPILPGGKREGYEERQERFDKLPFKDKSEITGETDRRYKEETGLKEKIKKGEKNKARVWLHIRDTIIAEREFVQNLPERVKRFIFFSAGDKKLKPEDYTKIIRIAKLVMSMTEEEVDEYLNLPVGPAGDLDQLEKSLKEFAKRGEGAKGGGEKGEGGKEEGEPGGGEKEGEKKKAGSKYGRFGLINLPQPIIKVLEVAAEILGDPEEAADLVDLIDEIMSLKDMSTDITAMLKDPDNLLMVALGLLDNPAIESIDTWVFKEEPKPRKKGKGVAKKPKGVKAILLKVRKLLPLIKKLLKPVFLARRTANGIQFRASLLIDKLPADSMRIILDLAKGKDKKTLDKEIASFAGNIASDISKELAEITDILSKLEAIEDVELINKEDLAKVVSKAVIKLAGGIYGKIASKVGLDEHIADIAKHGTKYAIPDAVVDAINDHLKSIFNEIKPFIEKASGEVKEILAGIDKVIAAELVPGLKTIVSPRSADAAGSAVPANTSGFLNNISTSRGQEVSRDIRDVMGPALGHDFRDVRFHTDAPAQDASRQLNAEAFTIKNDIYFGPHRYDTDSEEGLDLVTHEMIHVAQHNRDQLDGLISRRQAKASLRKRLAQKLVGRVLRGTGKTKRSIQGPDFIDYGYIDAMGRPRGIIARLKAPLATGTPANKRIKPPGFKGGPAGHARCHLLGSQLGGSGNDKRNLVACFQDLNNTDIKVLENKVRDAVNNGETILYKVIPLYKPKGKKPFKIRFIAKGDGSPATNIDETFTDRRK